MAGVRSLLCLAFVVVSMPVAALESGSRLVPGGAPGGERLRATAAETRLPLQTYGGYSLGVISESQQGAGALPFSAGRAALAVGGYVAYRFAEGDLTTSLRGDGERMIADLTASYGGALLGHDLTAALRLGASWRTPTTAFSPNAAQPLSLDLPAAARAPDGNDTGLNLTFSLTHEVTPSFSLRGVAEAISPTGGDSRNDGPGFRIGAGMGYRF